MLLDAIRPPPGRPLRARPARLKPAVSGGLEHVRVPFDAVSTSTTQYLQPVDSFDFKPRYFCHGQKQHMRPSTYSDSLNSARQTKLSLGPISAFGPNLAKALAWVPLSVALQLQVPPAPLFNSHRTKTGARLCSRYLHAVAQRPRRAPYSVTLQPCAASSIFAAHCHCG